MECSRKLRVKVVEVMKSQMLMTVVNQVKDFELYIDSNKDPWTDLERGEVITDFHFLKKEHSCCKVEKRLKLCRTSTKNQEGDCWGDLGERWGCPETEMWCLGWTQRQGESPAQRLAHWTVHNCLLNDMCIGGRSRWCLGQGQVSSLENRK